MKNNDKYLALYKAPHKVHGPGAWFVVTGSVEKNETLLEAANREVFEETGLAVQEIKYLNWGSVYNWHGEDCEEHHFICKVNLDKVTLNEEHIKYKWLKINDFVDAINWGDNKDFLKRILSSEKPLKRLILKNL